MENEALNGPDAKKPGGNANMYVIGGNMLLLVFYTIYIKTNDPNSDSIIALAFIIGFHVLLNIVAGIPLLFFRKLEKYGKACLLSSLAVLLIGFSTCFLVSS